MMKAKCLALFICSVMFLITAHAFDHIVIFGDSLSDGASFDDNLASLCEQHHINCSKYKGNKSTLSLSGNNYWTHSPGAVGAPIGNKAKTSDLVTIWTNDLMKLYFNQPKQQIIYPSDQARLLHMDINHINISYAISSAEAWDAYMNDASWDKAHPYPIAKTDCESHGPGLIKPGQACVPGLVKQVRIYFHDVKNTPNPKTLYLIWIGGNDVINNLTKIVLSNKDTAKPILLFKMFNAAYPMTENGVTPLSPAIKNTRKAVNLLLENGIDPRQIYVIELPDLAITPAAVKFTKGNSVGLFTLHCISALYNQLLKWSLCHHFFNHDIKLPSDHVISLHALIENIEDDPAKYGFINIDESCDKNGDTPYCEGYLFFNFKHPTDKGHQLIATHVFERISNTINL